MTQFVEKPANSISIGKRGLIHGVGINDSWYVTSPKINGVTVRCPYYVAWYGMMDRSYGEKVKSRIESYKNCSVVKEWHTFSVFRAWMETQDWKGKQLDKDLIVFGNKVYGPDTCMFVSAMVNSFLTDCNKNRGKYPLGVSFYKSSNCFYAECRIDGRQKRIGKFSDPVSAERAYLLFKSKFILEVSNRSESMNNNKLRMALIRIAEIFKNKADSL